MDYLLKCETNAQRLRVINLLKDHYLILDHTLKDINTEYDFLEYPNITIDKHINVSEITLIRRSYTSPYVILTEQEFLDRYLVKKTNVPQWEGNILKFKFI